MPRVPDPQRPSRRFVWLAMTILCGATPEGVAQTTAYPSVLKQGEDLVYNVRYGPFDLGQVRIRTYAPEHKGGTTTYSTRADINSYPNVPLVDLHAVFDCRLDSSMYSHRFASRMKDGDHWNTTHYVFDYSKNKVLLDMGRNDTVVTRRDTLPLNGPMQDGLSIFFYAREHLFAHRKVNVPIIVNEKLVNMYIDFIGERSSVEIDAVDHPVDVLRFDGNAQFTGIFGLTGDFEGWFSNDEARVPILAKMKVILGSVTIELMQWTRSGWSPPRGQP